MTTLKSLPHRGADGARAEKEKEKEKGSVDEKAKAKAKDEKERDAKAKAKARASEDQDFRVDALGVAAEVVAAVVAKVAAEKEAAKEKVLAANPGVADEDVAAERAEALDAPHPSSRLKIGANRMLARPI